MNAVDPAVAVSSAPTFAIAYSARLEWCSEQAIHADCLLVPVAALQGDGRWLAAGEKAQLHNEAVALDAAPWCRPTDRPAIELDANGLHLPADLQPGRHYPARLFGHAVGGPRDMFPVRLLGVQPEGKLLLDPNHPLAASSPRLLLTPTGKPAASGSRLTALFDGPGMQAPPADGDSCYFPPGSLVRRDETSDIGFYARARLVQHLDARCRAAIGELYLRLLRPGVRVLDMMASHDSHLPAALDLELHGLGLNDAELAANPRLTARVVQNINACPRLPWANASFDAVICTAAIEYLTRPHDVLAEARRVLRPGGVLAITFSDRWFPTKAIAVWSRLHEFERLGLVLHLLRKAGFVRLHSETQRGLPRPTEDTHISQRSHADPLFAAWGYAP